MYHYDAVTRYTLCIVIALLCGAGHPVEVEGVCVAVNTVIADRQRAGETVSTQQ
jgi:hypothetical protein